MLNTHTEYDFQDAFQNDRSAGNGAYERKRTIWKVMVANIAKVSFDQMVILVSEIIDTSLYAFSAFRVKEQVKAAYCLTYMATLKMEDKVFLRNVD